jgi:transposase
MARGRKRKYDSGFRAKVAGEAFKGNKTIAELCSEYGVSSSLICDWKKQLIDSLPSLFDSHPGRREREVDVDAIRDPLLHMIGNLQVENAFLKKKLRV